jgi:plastocyanin
MRRFLLPIAGLALTLALTACSQSGGLPSGSTAPASSDPNAPSIVAKDLKFEQASYQVPAGKTFTLTFDNRDSAPHNVVIASDEGFGSKLFEGEVFGGPAVKPYSVPALAAGTYYFRCEVHQDMKGTLVAK